MELPQRKRVKVEQEPEEVSTVTSGKVVVSTMGNARIVGRNQPAVEKKTGQKVLPRSRMDRATKKDIAVPKKKSSSARRDSIKIAAVKQDKATEQREETVHQASNQPAVGKKTGQKVLAKSRMDRATKKDDAVSKKKSSSVRRDSIKAVAVKQDKATKQREETVHKASKSSKLFTTQQPPRKKKRSV